MDNITYKKIDDEIFEKIISLFGEIVRSSIHLGEDDFSLVALSDETPVGIISVQKKQLTDPLEKFYDALISIVEVDEEFRRKGIGRHLVNQAEEWAAKGGFSQIRAWSGKDKPDSIKMWQSLGYCMCPATIGFLLMERNSSYSSVDGYFVVKKL